jgi:hypothetical protein
VRSNGSKQSGQCGKVRGGARLSRGPIPVVGRFPCAVEARDTVQARVERSLLAEEQFGRYRPEAIQVVKEGKW